MEKHKAMDRRGMTNDLVKLPGAGHVPFQDLEAKWTDVMGFLTQHMDLQHAQCPTPSLLV